MTTVSTHQGFSHKRRGTRNTKPSQRVKSLLRDVTNEFQYKFLRPRSYRHSLRLTLHARNMKLLLTSVLLCSCGIALGSEVASSFKSSEIVPDVLTTPPNDLLSVNFKGKSLQFGEELTPTLVKDVPNVSWKADPSSFYTICMTDPDAPSRREPKFREFLHWLVVNVPGEDIAKGDSLAAYVGSGPPKGTGLHRYVLLAYKQPNGKIDVSEEKRIPNNSRDGRAKFSIQKFADKYDFGSPIAGNMFQAQYDDYVPNITNQLNGGKA